VYLEQRLHGLEDRLDLVTSVRGKGLLWALQLSREAAEQVVLRCLERGLIVNNVRPDAVRLCPPLIVSREELDEGLSVLEEVLAEAGGAAAK
jgi:4-aminobutyrate aminotransferase-like enzyme